MVSERRLKTLITSENYMWKKGELVWVSLSFSDTWIPGRILDPSEPVGVLVSFFGLMEPLCVPELCLRSFHCDFEAVISDSGRFSRFVNRALRAHFWNISFGLWCSCQPPIESPYFDRENSIPWFPLSSQSALCYVRSMAVSPRVPLRGLAKTNSSSAEILSFRRYAVDFKRSESVYEEIRASAKLMGRSEESDWFLDPSNKMDCMDLGFMFPETADADMENSRDSSLHITCTSNKELSSDDVTIAPAEQLQNLEAGTTVESQTRSVDNVRSIGGVKRKESQDKASARNSKRKKKAGQQSISTDKPLNLHLMKDMRLANPKCLRMKFLSRHGNFPSKSELLKRFSVFGKIDASRTFVSPEESSAKVVFMQSIDAVTAYQFARSKKFRLGRSKVMYRLDPFEKDNEVNKVPSSQKPQKSVPSPKSCLKAWFSRDSSLGNPLQKDVPCCSSPSFVQPFDKVVQICTWNTRNPLTSSNSSTMKACETMARAAVHENDGHWSKSKECCQVEQSICLPNSDPSNEDIIEDDTASVTAPKVAVSEALPDVMIETHDDIIGLIDGPVTSRKQLSPLLDGSNNKAYLAKPVSFVVPGACHTLACSVRNKYANPRNKLDSSIISAKTLNEQSLEWNSFNGTRENCSDDALESHIVDVGQVSPHFTGTSNNELSSDDVTIAPAEQLQNLEAGTAVENQTRLVDNIRSIGGVKRNESQDKESAHNSKRKKKAGQQSISTDKPLNLHLMKDMRLADPKCLRMKFLSRHGNFPSKSELLKRFSVFGKIDASRTFVSPEESSAKVVFMQSIDAVTAYQFARSKKFRLERSKVSYRLDPFEEDNEVNKVPSSQKLQKSVPSPKDHDSRNMVQ